MPTKSESKLTKVYKALKTNNIVSTKKDFADKLEYNYVYLVEVMGNPDKVSPSLIRTLEEKFNVNPNYFYKETNQMFINELITNSLELKNDQNQKKKSLGNTEIKLNLHRTGEEIRLQKAIGNTDEEGLIYVPISAQAGYTHHYTDPIYLNELDRLYIPNLPYRGENYRYFDIDGDSMSPTLEEGMQVIGQKIEQGQWKFISNFYIHIVVTINRVMVKRLFKKDDSTLILISDNDSLYPQESISLSEIKELWLVKRMLDWRMAPPKQFQIDSKFD